MSLKHYYEALERLKNGTPEILEGDYKINNDTVALEAGRKRGSIKAKRHKDLVSAIAKAAESKEGLGDNVEAYKNILTFLSSFGNSICEQFLIPLPIICSILYK